MRALVVGSLPPPMTVRSRALLAKVLELRAEGYQVEVLSPGEHSVAHRYLELPGAACALEIALAAKGADAVVLQLEPGFPVAGGTSRAGRALGLGALASALRSTRGGVVVRLHSMHDLPQGAGGRAAEALWAVAARIEVGDDETLQALSGQLGEEARRKLVRAAAPLEIGGVAGPEGPLAGDAGLEEVSRLVRSRAAADRAELLETGQGELRVPLSQWVPEPGAGVPDWTGEQSRPPSQRGSRPVRAARALLYAAEGRSLTRPLARGVRLARELARQR